MRSMHTPEIDEGFALFRAAYPPSGTRAPFDAARHADFARRVPASLAAEWRRAGFGAYGGGLVWLPVPDEPILDPHHWDALDDTGIEVLRTAFGSVCVWQGGSFRFLNIHTGHVALFPPDPDILFGSVLTEKNFRKRVLFEPLFKRGCQRHGPLGPNECFGFAPLPSLGGATSEAYLIKTELRSYAAMAAAAT